MAQRIQYCRCKINLAGQNHYTIHLNEYEPVTWPEVQVLMFLHGEENVMEIVPVGIGEVYPTAEKNRLASIYGTRAVETCFPGRSFRMEYMMTEDTDLPFYVDGVLASPHSDPKPPPMQKPTEPPPGVKPPPTLPPPEPPGTDHDDGEDDDDVAAAKTALAAEISFTPDPAVLKPGRGRPSSRPGA